MSNHVAPNVSVCPGSRRLKKVQETRKKSFPKPKECYGKFRDDSPEEKKEECFVCSKYVDCIQKSFRMQRLHRSEIRHFLAIIYRRIEMLEQRKSKAG